ncbi:MAG: histidine phosphatase family protein [Acidimicrobiales bacterium]
MATRVLLVRHGQSEWNAAGRWQGQADPPLSELGREQARLAAGRVGAIDAIFASDLQRATETALVISKLIGVGPVVVEPDLRERDAGEWSGLTRAEIDERYPGWLASLADRHGAFQPIRRDSRSGDRRPPGWEPDDVLLARALDALSRIHAAVPDGDVLAVTHGGLIYTVEHHLGSDVHRLANGEGRFVTVTGRHLGLGERILLVDDAAVTRPDQI